MEAWFDKETGVFRLDEVAMQRASFRRILEDQVVTDEELAEQSALCVRCLKEAHAVLDDSQRETVLEAMAEIAVLYAVNQHRNSHEFARTIKEFGI